MGKQENVSRLEPTLISFSRLLQAVSTLRLPKSYYNFHLLLRSLSKSEHRNSGQRRAGVPIFIQGQPNRKTGTGNRWVLNFDKDVSTKLLFNFSITTWTEGSGVRLFRLQFMSRLSALINSRRARKGLNSHVRITPRSLFILQ